MNHINITDKHQCCGCTACASVCNHQAITMQPDNLGFLYPQIDETKCVDCGICVDVCAFNDSYETPLNLKQPESYAVRHKDMDEIACSQSGAAFVLLSDWILDNGGVVYGVGYEGHFHVLHKRATTPKERDEFRGSKYVQSDLRGVFDLVKSDLKDGKMVCFSGTPCQVAGLASFVGNKLREKLFLIDIVCHGVPGPKIWEDYLDYLEAKEKKRITAVNFRDKKLKGWRSHVESFVFDDTYTYTYTYTYLFYTHINLRHSCSVCHFCNTRRPSDVTIADFWGIERINEEFAADNKGCSLMLVNTPKGKEWFNSIKENAVVLKTKLEDSLQPQLCHPNPQHPQRDAFEQDYANLGFKKTLEKWEFIGWKRIAKKYLGYPFRLAKRTIKKYI